MCGNLVLSFRSHTHYIATTFRLVLVTLGCPVMVYLIKEIDKLPNSSLSDICRLIKLMSINQSMSVKRVCHIGGAHSVIEYGGMHLEEFVALLSSHWASYVAIAKLLYQCQYIKAESSLTVIICKTLHYREFGGSVQLYMQHIIGCLLDLYILYPCSALFIIMYSHGPTLTCRKCVNLHMVVYLHPCTHSLV